jgi:hypothetical protein
MNVKITFIPSIYENETYEGDTAYRKDLPPGSAQWSHMDGSRPDSPVGALHFVCPCGCGAVIGVSVKPAIPEGWNWNGSLDKPTLSPSILRTAGCRWHGFLTDGEFNGA